MAAGYLEGVVAVADTWVYPFVTASSRLRIARATSVQAARSMAFPASRTRDPGGIQLFAIEPLALLVGKKLRASPAHRARGERARQRRNEIPGAILDTFPVPWPR